MKNDVMRDRFEEECLQQMPGHTGAVFRLVWPFDGIVQKHIHKRLI